MWTFQRSTNRQILLFNCSVKKRKKMVCFFFFLNISNTNSHLLVRLNELWHSTIIKNRLEQINEETGEVDKEEEEEEEREEKEKTTPEVRPQHTKYDNGLDGVVAFLSTKTNVRTDLWRTFDGWKHGKETTTKIWFVLCFLVHTRAPLCWRNKSKSSYTDLYRIILSRYDDSSGFSYEFLKSVLRSSFMIYIFDETTIDFLVHAETCGIVVRFCKARPTKSIVNVCFSNCESFI